MRILLIDLAKAFGGAEVRVLTQARELQSKVDVCKVAVLKNSALHQRLISENLPHIVIESGRSSPALLLKLRDIMRAENIHVVDAHNVQSIMWSITSAWLANVKGRVSTIHSDYGAEYPNMKGRFYEGVLTVTRPITQQVINVTEVLQEKSKREGIAHKASLIANAVPVPNAPHGKRNSAQEWGFSEHDFVIGIPARLKTVKGHSYLIDAFAQLSDLPHVKLLIVGEGELEAELKAQVERLNLGHRSFLLVFGRIYPIFCNLLIVCALLRFLKHSPTLS
jgi:glycosyltransferase involved in cell wall biosynthesis